MDRKETGDIVAGVNKDIAAGVSAYPTQAWGDLVVRRSLLPEYKAIDVAASIHIAKLGGDTDVPTVKGPYAVIPHVPRAERISRAGIDDHLVGRPEIDIAIESLDIGTALQVNPIAAGGGAGGQVLRPGRQGYAPVIARYNCGAIIQSDTIARGQGQQRGCARIGEGPDRAERDVVVRLEADLVKAGIKDRGQRVHESRVQCEVVRIKGKLSAEEPAGRVGVDRRLDGPEGGGGDLDLTAIAALRSARDVDGRSGLVGEGIAGLDGDRSPGTGTLAVALGGEDRIRTQVDGIAGDQLDDAIDFAH